MKPFRLHIRLLVLLFAIGLGGKTVATATDAQNYFDRGQFDSAWTAYNRLLQRYPDSPSLYFNRGLCAYRLAKNEEALADFDHALALDSNHQAAHYAKALLLEENGNTADYRQELKKLYRLNRNYKDVKKRIQIDAFAVYISRNWYYMIVMAFLLIVLLATISTLLRSKRI